MANTKIPVELSSTPGIVDGSNATAITIDSSENVGIGTASPDDKLHIEGTDTSTSDTFGLKITNGSSTTNTTAGILFENYDNHNAYIRSLRSGSSSGILTFGTNTGGGIAESNISERMRIDGSGVVFIGGTAHFSGGSNADDATVAVNGGVTRKGIAFSDFNEAYVNDPKGIFEGTGTYQASNGPSGAGNFFHLVSKTLATSGSSANNYVTQVATSITGTIHTRYSTNNGSTWTSWQQV